MWFKNLQLFQLNKDIELDLSKLESQLEAFRFEPCKSIETYRLGWTLPAPTAVQLHHASGGAILLCLRRQEKVIPAAVVNETLKERVEELEAKENRHVGRKEKLTIKEDILSELTPRAFVRSSFTWGYISPADKLVVVDASSAKKADEFLDLLRQTIGSLPVVPFNTEQSPSIVMTEWLQDASKRPQGLELDGQCELRSDLEEGSVIRCKQQELDAEEILAHIETGKQVVKLAINWQERIQFILQEDLVIKRLRFGDDLLDEAKDSYGDEDPMTRLDTDFSLMTLELKRFIPTLAEWLGGQTNLGSN
ncbi:recombination-associated protein RdgC [Oceanospirillum sanctuarii]|uniref:recombination-associated protein RdgC n=1 Tax=Oceanospirillum sanctuarii TaxID=1434821 RepID=UPI000A3A04F0|nr:recombination-associated protein RdgC [Oceanospirillum sanctuarii]